MTYIFSDLIERTPSLNNPFVCEIVEIINFDETNEYTMCKLEDDGGNTVLGFFYKRFAEILSFPFVKARLPFKITVIKGKMEKLKESLIFEIYNAVFEKNTLINSSTVSGYEYCPASTYLNTQIHAEGNLNPNLLFGVIFHDYLSILFDDRNLLKLQPNDPLISEKILTAYQHAIFDNWRLLTAVDVDCKRIYRSFKYYYLDNEVNFVNSELKKLNADDADWSFQAEKMIRSKNFGLQGRIDRVLWNQTGNSFTIYETKTGKSSASSHEVAKYQLISYSIILREYFQKEMEKLILEYPRNSLRERLKSVGYDDDTFYKLISIRNEIWAISIGNRPVNGPYMHCGRCFSKDICSFYCLRSFLTKNCLQCNKCKYDSILQKREDFEEFRRVNVYFDWFSRFLDIEFLANMTKRAEFNLEPEEREKLGNCLSDMIIKNDNLATDIDKSNQIISTSTKDSDSISLKISMVFTKKLDSSGKPVPLPPSRFKEGDYILLTPQDHKPLTVQSFSGNIKSISSENVVIKFFSDSYNSINDFPANSFRIDSSVSDIMLRQQRTVLDKFLRLPFNMANENLRQIRNLLLNFDNKQGSKDSALKSLISDHEMKELRVDLSKKGFNEEQNEAILKSLRFKGIFLIHGPPGTGKTTVIAEIISQLNSRVSISSPPAKKSAVNEIFSKNESDNPEMDDFFFENKPTTKKILISAFTNKAVDTIIEKLAENNPKLNIVRIGNESSISPNIIPLSLDYRSRESVEFENGQKFEVNSPKLARKILEEADVIAATCLGAGSNILTNFKFEYVIIDETGQVVEPIALIPLLKGNNIILVGDDNQLPPISSNIVYPEVDDEFLESKVYLQEFRLNKQYIITSKDIDSKKPDRKKEIFLKELKNLELKPEDTLSTSLFQRLKRIFSKTDRFIAFSQQYRMNKVISDFASESFYNGMLNPAKAIGQKNLKDFFDNLKISFYQEIETRSKQRKKNIIEDIFRFTFDSNKSMIFLDTKSLKAFDSSTENQFDDLSSKFNEIEAEFISMLLVLFINYVNYSIQSANLKDEEEVFITILKNIGIITPYRAQVRLIRNKIVDKFKNNLNLLQLIKNNLIIDTVDRFQGNEAEIIIISIVDSNSDDRKLGELYNETKRLNVSITRAKTKLILLGNSEMFETKYPSSRTRKKGQKQTDLLDFMTKTNSKYDSVKKPAEKILSDLVKYIKKREGYIELSDLTSDYSAEN